MPNRCPVRGQAKTSEMLCAGTGPILIKKSPYLLDMNTRIVVTAIVFASACGLVGGKFREVA